MRTIGLIGGTSWHSTIDYYRIINETANQRRGGHTSAKILLYSVDFAEVEALTKKLDWDGVAGILCDAASRLEKGGADCILLCANTMHINAEKVQASVSIPLIHVADVVAKAIQAQKLDTVLLLGTKYTMLADFYASRLRRDGIQLLIPAGNRLETINDSIYGELSHGELRPSTKSMYLDVIDENKRLGAQGVILGCTEIPLLLQQPDCDIPLFDTTRLHALAAVDFAGY